MAIAAADPARGDGLQRGRGGFWRKSDDTPYVSDPSGAVVKSGPRKGLPKLTPYGQPSNRGKQIENTTNLTKWGERRTVLGIGANPELVEMCQALTGLDVDSDEYRTLADTIVLRAKEAAQASLAADRGTHSHLLTEGHDEQGRDIVELAEAGELLGMDAALQRRIAVGWGALCATHGLEILAVEATVVDDLWRLAGTLDRIARCTRDLRFVLNGGEVVVVPAGTIVVLDIKTGKWRTDRNGAVLYWHGYSIQVASYAQAVPYDTDTDTRGEWPWPVSQEHALIAHLDVAALIAGEDVDWQLVYVDLVAGREHGGACVVMAKAWEARTDVFSIAQLATEETASSPVAPASPGGDTTPQPVEADTPAPARLTPDPARVEAADQQAAVRDRGVPDEGGPAVDFDTLQRAYEALDPASRAWIKQLASEATQGGVSFHAKAAKSLRRFELLRGLVTLGRYEVCDDGMLRGLLELTVGDVAQFPSVPAGHVLGSLSAVEAAQFAHHCDLFVAGGLPVAVRDDGSFDLGRAA